MRNFFLGIVVAILVLLIGTLGVALLGFLPLAPIVRRPSWNATSP